MKPSDQDQNELSAADEAAFNEYLRRDSAVSQRYRELDAVEVPPALDQAVLLQAKAAVADRRVTRLKGPGRGIVRWSAPLALAASVVVVVSVVMRPAMQKEISSSAYPLSAPSESAPQVQESIQLPEARNESRRADQEFSILSAPKPQPASAAPVESNASQEKRLAAKNSVTVVRERERYASGSEDPVQVTTMPPREFVIAIPAPALPPQSDISATTTPAPAQPSARTAAKEEAFTLTGQQRDADLSQVIVTGSFVRRQPAGNGAGPRGTVGAVTDAAPEPESEELPRLNRNDPGQWLVYIRAVRGKGDIERADTEWRRFRQTYPDFAVEENDAARPPRR